VLALGNAITANMAVDNCLFCSYSTHFTIILNHL